MAKRKKTDRESASEPSGGRELSWKEERFIEAYISSKGSGAYAAREAGYRGHSARQMACELLAKPYIAQAVEEERERLRQILKFDREQALAILVGMATATQDDFTDVLKDPEDKDAYKGLGFKKYAIKGAKKSYKNGNEIQLVDRKAALDDLWEKLGLGKESSKQDWSDGLGRVLGLLDKFKKPVGSST